MKGQYVLSYIIVRGVGSRRWHVYNLFTNSDEGGIFVSSRAAKNYIADKFESLAKKLRK